VIGVTSPEGATGITVALFVFDYIEGLKMRRMEQSREKLR